MILSSLLPSNVVMAGGADLLDCIDANDVLVALWASPGIASFEWVFCSRRSAAMGAAFVTPVSVDRITGSSSRLSRTSRSIGIGCEVLGPRAQLNRTFNLPVEIHHTARTS
jgi:hypothetical protein